MCLRNYGKVMLTIFKFIVFLLAYLCVLLFADNNLLIKIN